MNMYTHVPLFMYVHSSCIHIHAYMHTYSCIHAYAGGHICIYACIQKHSDKYKHITYIQTHIFVIQTCSGQAYGHCRYMYTYAHTHNKINKTCSWLAETVHTHMFAHRYVHKHMFAHRYVHTHMFAKDMYIHTCLHTYITTLTWCAPVEQYYIHTHTHACMHSAVQRSHKHIHILCTNRLADG